MPAGDRLTRRGMLASVGAAGASALAGCGGIGDLTGSGETTIRSHELPEVDPDENRQLVAPTVPVAIDGAHLAAARDRTTSLLAELPMPLGPDEIPNGHVRGRLLGAADDATDALDEARRAETDFVALRELRRSRERARYAAGGWRFAAGSQSLVDLRSARQDAVAEAREFESSREYRGSDPVRAALVHARIEALLRRATDDDSPHTEADGGGLLTVAEWAEEVETARALLADARHLGSQFSASLSADAGTVEAELRRAAETLLADVRSRRDDLPPEPTADDWGARERIVHELRSDADYGAKRVADAAGPASAALDATGRLAAFAALDGVLERIESGEQFAVESAADVRRYRQTAVDALTSALTGSPEPGLTRTVLTDAAGHVWSADWELSRLSGEVRPARLTDPVSSYVVAAALARAAPKASERAAEALTSA
ncbi:hypothetical protein [Haloarcula nitratireducens]|uniref:Uncharacterized protein n=1 Tax=Haloarcula nitratireducens TaxID=2487749 RepID=A0AAW4P6K8_9EURY|nr:hypothetical protein [Halomicroarcula nitratireducens]MBX0293507.1 hypothetical protein [Halomicroarcula nitratireducens]